MACCIDGVTRTSVDIMVVPDGLIMVAVVARWWDRLKIGVWVVMMTAWSDLAPDGLFRGGRRSQMPDCIPLTRAVEGGLFGECWTR